MFTDGLRKMYKTKDSVACSINPVLERDGS